jgi:hypothetical protein
MSEETVTLEQLSEVEGFCGDIGIDVEFRTDYSGRGMYGRTCLGAVLENDGDALVLAIAFAEVLGAEDAIELVRRTSTDSMGRGTIHYWRHVEVAPDE